MTNDAAAAEQRQGGAPEQCVDCGTIISICEHAMKRIADVSNVMVPAEAPPPRLSAEDEYSLRERHQERARGKLFNGPHGACVACMLPYPCPTAILLSEIGALRAERDLAKRWLAQEQEGRQKVHGEMMDSLVSLEDQRNVAEARIRVLEAALLPQSSGGEGDEFEPVAYTCLVCDGSGPTRAEVAHDSWCWGGKALAAASSPATDLASVRRQIKALPPDAEGFTWMLARVKAMERPDLVIEDETAAASSPAEPPAAAEDV